MRRHLPFAIFFLIFIIIGACIYDDYGVSWDEAECRIDNGILNTTFIRTGNEKPLLESISKYHGASYEMVLVFIEKSSGLESTREIFLMRHLVTFLLFALSVFFFYLLCLKAFGSGWYALAGCLFLVLCPRIFADSFYNSKDLPFLSLFIISFYLLVKFIQKKNILSAAIAAFVTGLMIDIRIMGIILPAFAYLILVVEFIRNNNGRKRIFISAISFTLILTGTVILFWPVLWLNPIKHFFLAWSELSKYPWEGKVLYNGIIYKAEDLPWHYLPVWFIITTPFLYTAFFATGFFVLLKKIFYRSQLNLIESFSMFIATVPLISVLVLKSIVYDGWRHLFFIYPAIVIIAVTGLQSIMRLLRPDYLKYFSATIAAYFASVIISMAELHPFQNVYFNFLAWDKEKPVRERFEMDYWGLSYKQAYEWILENDTSKNIFVALGEGQPGIDNMLVLPKDQRDRITTTDYTELAGYYITCHRYDRKLKEYSPVHRISAGGNIVHSIYDLRKRTISLDAIHPMISYSNKYETVPDGFSPGIIERDSVNGLINYSERITSQAEYGGNFNINVPEEFINASSVKYVQVSGKVLSEKSFRSRIVLQLDSSKTYHWTYHILNNSYTNSWNHFNYSWKLPEIYSTIDVLKIHFQNFEQGNFKLDDFTIKFYAIDPVQIDEIQQKLPL